MDGEKSAYDRRKKKLEGKDGLVSPPIPTVGMDRRENPTTVDDIKEKAKRANEQKKSDKKGKKSDKQREKLRKQGKN